MIRFDDIEYASLSDVGVRRSHNQDSLAALPATDREQWERRGHVFMVADGMGAHAVGELASKLAADGIPHIYSKHAHDGPTAALERAFIETNLGIYTRGQQNREFAGMGTTGTALVVRPEGAWIAHVGDSRCYRVRGGKIQQLTFDHSLLWELARRQRKPPEEVVGVPANVIVRSLGSTEYVQVDIDGPYPLEPDDCFVLCSDGLSGQVSDREIGAVIGNLPPEEACRFLINLANLQGGPDNITVIVVRVTGQAALTPVEETEPPGTTSWKLLASRFVPHAMAVGKKIAKQLPWPLVLLGLGISLAVLAIYLTAFQRPGDVLTFIAATMLLAGGSAGLLLQRKRERQEEPPQLPPLAALRVYREVVCDLALPVVQRLESAVANLDEQIKEKNWQVNREVCQDHRAQGRLFLDQGDLPSAFREDCRAMLLLMEAVSRQRNKEEAFRPVWDKAPA